MRVAAAAVDQVRGQGAQDRRQITGQRREKQARIRLLRRAACQARDREAENEETGQWRSQQRNGEQPHARSRRIDRHRRQTKQDGDRRKSNVWPHDVHLLVGAICPKNRQSTIATIQDDAGLYEVRDTSTPPPLLCNSPLAPSAARISGARSLPKHMSLCLSCRRRSSAIRSPGARSIHGVFAQCVLNVGARNSLEERHWLNAHALSDACQNIILSKCPPRGANRPRTFPSRIARSCPVAWKAR